MNLADKIIDYESGELSDEDIVDLFSELVKFGMAWSLQGSYGRMADNLIGQGILDESGEIDYDQINQLALDGEL